MSFFTGEWITRNGSVVSVEKGIAKVIKSKLKYIIGWEFPIDNAGNCSISHDLDLIEKQISLEGGPKVRK